MTLLLCRVETDKFSCLPLKVLKDRQREIERDQRLELAGNMLAAHVDYRISEYFTMTIVKCRLIYTDDKFQIGVNVMSWSQTRREMFSCWQRKARRTSVGVKKNVMYQRESHLARWSEYEPFCMAIISSASNWILWETNRSTNRIWLMD